LNATWSQFDLDSGVWVKPSAHTKQKRSHRVPLSPAAVELLRSVRAKMIEAATDRAGVVALKKIGAQVFPGRFGVGPLTDIKKSWATICAAADLRDVHLHDLRHTYASLLASDGISLPIIGQLLGHTQPGTTARYAHLFDNPLREATTRVAELLSESDFGAGLVELKPAER
jgi:integrase